LSFSNSKFQRLTSEEVKAITPELWEGFPCSLDFLRGFNVDSVRAEKLESCGDTEKGLSAKFESDMGAVFFLAEKLPWDSQHFGLSTCRIEAILLEHPSRGLVEKTALLSSALPFWSNFLKSEGIDYAFANIDTRSNILIAELSRAGYVPLETRVNFWRDLGSLESSRRYAVRLATVNDLESLEAASSQNINLLDRFHADPVLPQEKVDELMRLWIRNSIIGGFADGAIVPDMSPPDAFCTFKLHKEQWEKWGVKAAQPILAAVSPNRRGWYVKIMSEVSHYLKETGAEKAYMTTQLGNSAVIRSWNSLGYSLGSGEITLRWACCET
jgi:hypothetical protein